MLRNSRILKVQFNFFFSIQRSQFQWQLVIWEKSDFDIHHGKLLSRLIVTHIKLMISLFFLKINSMYLNIPSAMLNEPWDLSTIIPFLLTGWRLNQFYPLRIYKEKCDFFLVGGGNNWVKISGTDSLNEETLYSSQKCSLYRKVWWLRSWGLQVFHLCWFIDSPREIRWRKE